MLTRVVCVQDDDESLVDVAAASSLDVTARMAALVEDGVVDVFEIVLDEVDDVVDCSVEDVCELGQHDSHHESLTSKIRQGNMRTIAT